jgi:multiple sugar transport system substrate-binding protein
MKRVAWLLISLALLIPSIGLFAAEKQVTTITYGFWDANQRPAIESLVAAFQKENPNIQIQIMVVPWGEYWTKLQASVAGGQAFDTFWMNGPYFPIYASQGVLKEMGPDFKKAGIDMSKYSKSLSDMYTYKNKIYGLPKDYDTIGLFYNKDLFDKAGVSYPTENWTFDDLKSAAKKLTDPAKQVWGFASTTSDQQGWWNFVFANGGKLLSDDQTKILVDQGAAREALSYLYSFVKEGLSPDASTVASIDAWSQLFPNGKLAMITAGSWMAKTYSEAQFRMDVAPIPKGKAGHATVIHGVANVVWSKGKNIDVATKFVDFLVSKKAQEIVAASGSVIPAYEGLADAWIKSNPKMNTKVFIDAVKYAIPYPASVKGMEWNDKISNALSDIWNGAISFDDGMVKLANDANAALKAAK